MSELTTEEVIKIIIAVMVLTVVVMGAVVAFRNYVIPYFNDLGPSGQSVDTNTPFYQELLKDDHLVGIVDNDPSKSFISLKKEESGRKDFSKTDFYFYKQTGKVYKYIDVAWYNPFSWERDTLVGNTDDKGVIFIDSKYVGEIGDINGAIRIGQEIRKQ